LQYNFNWDSLSAVAGLTFYNFYFRLYQGSVKSAEVVDFLAALLRHIPGPLLIIWDRLSAHRSKLTRDFIAGQGERLWVEYLPGYAPELNPVEYIWAYWKQHALPNVCPKDYWSLDETARRSHTFEFITPAMTELYDIPNPCTSCHKDKTTTWAKQVLRTWRDRSPWRDAE